jgi:phosphate-selective porin
VGTHAAGVQSGTTTDAAASAGRAEEENMKPRIPLLVVAFALALAFEAAPLVAADVTGKWAATFDTQVGPQKYTFDLKADGAKLTGKAAFERMGEKGEADLLEGKVDGDEVSFVETFDAMGSTVRIEYKGKVNGDAIAFTRKVGEFGTEQFVATRVKN